LSVLQDFSILGVLTLLSTPVENIKTSFEVTTSFLHNHTDEKYKKQPTINPMPFARMTLNFPFNLLYLFNIFYVIFRNPWHRAIPL